MSAFHPKRTFEPAGTRRMAHIGEYDSAIDA